MPYIKPKPEQIRSWVENNFQYKKRHSGKRGDIYLIDSPFVPGDTGWHVGISINEGWVRDFRPQYDNLHRKSFIGFVADVEGIKFAEAAKLIMGNDAAAAMAAAERALLKDKEIIEQVEVSPTKELPKGIFKVSDDRAKEKHPRAWQTAVSYLNYRGITLEEINKYGVMFDATSIIFPYYEYGELVYWQRRDLINKTFEFPPVTNEYLWGYDDIEPRGTLYLIESIFNGTSIGSGAGATGGASLKDRQLRLIRMLQPSKIILGPDNDEAGLISIRKEYYQLSPYFKDELYYCLPPVGKDWNDMAQEMGRLNNKNVIKNWIDQNTKKLTQFSVLQLTMNIKPIKSNSANTLRKPKS